MEENQKETKTPNNKIKENQEQTGRSKARYTPIVDGVPSKLVTPQTPSFLGYCIEVLKQSLRDAELSNNKDLFQSNPRHFWIGTSQKWNPDKSHSPDSTLTPDKLHSHDYMQLFYVVDGSMTHNFNGREYLQKKGDLLIVPPFFSHMIYVNSYEHVMFVQCEFAECFINPDVTEENNDTPFKNMYLQPVLFHASQISPLVSFQNLELTRIENILYDIMNEYQTGTTFSFNYIRLRIIELLSIIIAEYEKTTPMQIDLPLSDHRTAITRSLAFMSENFQENISRKEVCDSAKMSVSSFSHIFKQVMGKTFVEHVNYLRVHQAQHLLADTDKSLVDICYECGFCDGAYFSNIFKKFTSCTPRAYRNLCKG